MKSIKKLFAGVSAFAIIGFSGFGVQSAFAADTTVTGQQTINYAAPTVSNFSNITLSGHVDPAYANIPNSTLTDATGTGNGWHIDISASKFAGTINGSSVTLNNAKLYVATPTVSAETGSNTTGLVLPDNSTSSIFDGQVTLVQAPQNAGMGTFDISFPTNSLTLNVEPSETYAGTYSSTVTVSLVAGP